MSNEFKELTSHKKMRVRRGGPRIGERFAIHPDLRMHRICGMTWHKRRSFIIPTEFLTHLDVKQLTRVVVWMNDNGDLGVWNTSLHVPDGVCIQSTMVGAIEILRDMDRFVVLDHPGDDGSLQYDFDEDHLSYEIHHGHIDPIQWPEVTFEELMVAAWGDCFANTPDSPIYKAEAA
jgi:hypothetical protein